MELLEKHKQKKYEKQRYQNVNSTLFQGGIMDNP